MSMGRLPKTGHGITLSWAEQIDRRLAGPFFPAALQVARQRWRLASNRLYSNSGFEMFRGRRCKHPTSESLYLNMGTGCPWAGHDKMALDLALFFSQPPLNSLVNAGALVPIGSAEFTRCMRLRLVCDIRHVTKMLVKPLNQLRVRPVRQKRNVTTYSARQID